MEKIKEMVGKWADSYERNGYFNGAMLIAAGGEILLNKGFGMANFEHSVPNQTTTKFRIGSLTKAFTAAAIFQLHEAGKLNVFDCIDKYLKDYPAGGQITIYHCLTNTAGIPNYTSFPDFWFKTMRLPATLEQVIDSFKNLDLEFEPGSQFEYSSSGFALLTAIIEKVSGVSYGNYIEEKICRPLGLENTGCDDGVKIVPGLASGYSYWEKPVHAAYADLSFPLGGYGLYSTTEDLLRWDQALKSCELVSREMSELMFKPNLDSYACGWEVSKIWGRKCLNHFGDISGYFSDFLRFVEDDVTVIFLSNMNVTPVTHLTREAASVVFGEEVSLPIPADPVHLNVNNERFVGKYLLENDQELDISCKNGDLYLTVAKMYGVLYKFKLVPVGSTDGAVTFVTEMINEQLKFYYSQAGDVELVQYVDFYGKTHRGKAAL